jgi:glycosyltransferase involved in cell wall biosynthesis
MQPEHVPQHPQVSVIVPVFNGERYLQSCIRSVLGQRFDDFELLLADDCSTDRSLEIIQGFSDERIRHYRHAKNVGLFASLNQLVSSARAPIVRLLGQDDVLAPDCLASEVEFLATHPSVGMAYCKYRLIDEAGQETGEGPVGDLPEVVQPNLSLQYYYYYGCLPGNISTVCVRRECFEAVGLFDEDFRVAGDYEMWVRICRHRDLGVLHKRLVQLRIHENQLSRAPSSGIAYVSEHRQVRQTLLACLPETSQTDARLHFLLRQNVSDTHFAIRCLLAGRIQDFASVLSVMGPAYFAAGLLFWLLTVNNHLFRPRPRFVFD